MMQELVANIEAAARDVMNEMHTITAGKIVSFDVSSCTASIKPAGRLKKPDGGYLNYPVLYNVPVVMPKFGGCSLAVPIKEEMDCILLFMEASENNDFKYDLTNAVALIGCLGGADDSQMYSQAVQQDAIILKNGDTELLVKDGMVSVKGTFKVEGSILYTGSCTRI